jgi:drug/metabolite transporter (DMT)-like permease
LTAAVGISTAPIFVRLALPAPPLAMGLYRMLFASLLVGAWLAWRRPVWPPRRAALAALAAGLCFGSDLALWQTALVQTSVATATLLVNTTPVYVGLYALCVRREALHGRFAAGALLAMAGAAALVGISRGDLLALRGALLSLGAALFYSVYLILMAGARRQADAAPALWLASVGATAALALYAALTGTPFRGFPAHSWAAMLGAAVVAQIGGVMGIVWALRFVPTTLASVALLVQPVGAALLAWWLFGEALSPVQALGGAAVLAGILLASGEMRRPPPYGTE